MGYDFVALPIETGGRQPEEAEQFLDRLVKYAGTAKAAPSRSFTEPTTGAAAAGLPPKKAKVKRGAFGFFNSQQPGDSGGGNDAERPFSFSFGSTRNSSTQSLTHSPSTTHKRRQYRR